MLSIRHKRNGTAIKTPWTLWHLGIVIQKFPEIRSTGMVTITEPLSFSIDESALFTDATPGAIYTWELLPNDTLEVWR